MADLQSYAFEIERIIRNELDDAERYMKRDDKQRALRELDDGMTKLKRIVARLRSE